MLVLNVIVTSNKLIAEKNLTAEQAHWVMDAMPFLNINKNTWKSYSSVVGTVVKVEASNVAAANQRFRVLLVNQNVGINI